MYNKGDFIADFRRRVIFEFPGADILPVTKLFKCRLLTPGEALIFRREFKGRKEITFAEFKEAMPIFDGRKLRNMVYGYIPMTESQYLFFRSMKTDLIYTPDYSDKLSLLISNYINPIIHNSEKDTQIQAFREFKRLLSDILKDTKE